MALTLLQQYPNFLELQAIFDPIQQQQRSNSVTTPVDPLNCINADQMEYTAISNNNNSSHHQSALGSSNNNNNNNFGGHINNGGGVEDTNHFISGLIHQQLNNSNRAFVSGYHHQHISNDYEQVINFVDSPPNSEESWTDEHSKGSPGPQIIEVQTICSNSGARKRRMDWDSLDIGQSGNTISAQNGEVTNKIPHLRVNPNDGQTSAQQQDKEKQKKEKLSGRGSWTDDIDFDLNAEFSTNSYLNNETFLSFSPALTVLKQEPQSEQLKENKSSTICVSKIDKAIEDTTTNSNSKLKQKNDLNETVCGCGSPQSTQPGFEQNLRSEKVSPSVTGNDKHTGLGADKANSRQSSPEIQQAENVAAATSLSDDNKFQYILAAATSIATKNNEETLTYLNQGQSYEIKLKKTGDLSFYRDKILKSVIKICFHERRLQYMEREQMQQWQVSRPGERIIEVDVPLSYGLCHVSQPLSSNFLSTVEVFWDPLKEVGVYIKVNCISTEFTPKKHGGEKGVPFRLQIETYIENTNSTNVTASAASSPLSTTGATTSGIPGNLTPSNSNASSLGASKQPVHAAACQIKVFKLKGADRKHKQDREKIQKRPQSEQDKFQPSYECTIMNDIPLDLIIPSSGCFSPEYMKVWPNSPVHIPKYDGILPYTSTSPASNSSPIAINSVTSSNSPTLKLMETNMVSPQQVPSDMDDYVMNIMPDSTPAQVTQWLTYHRMNSYITTFAHFSGADIMRMSKEDLIQICGLADGIRMFNILRAKVISPRLTVYVSMDGSSYNAIYLISNTAKELTQKLYKLPGFYEFIANNGNSRSMENGVLFNSWSMHSKYSGSGSNIFNDVTKTSIYITGPSGVHVTVTDEVLNNEIKDGSLYALEVISGKVIMKLIIKNDN